MTPAGTIICCVLLASAPAEPQAAARRAFVPNDYPTIQGAIDAVNNGAIVIVLPGTYYEHIDFKGKAIHVRSYNPTDPATVAATIIDGTEDAQKHGNVVTFDEHEGNGSILSGFTIQNGWHGVRVLESSPWIRYCVIKDNDAGGDTTSWASGGTDWGGGVAVGYDYRYEEQDTWNYAVQVENCTIQENRAIGGAGIYFHGSSSGTLVSSNSILSNSTYDTYNPPRDGYGGGGYVKNLAEDPDSLTMLNNLFNGNGTITDPLEGGDLVSAIWAYWVTFNSNTLTHHAYLGAPVRFTGCKADANQIVDVYCYRQREPCEKYAVALLGQGSVFTNNIVETGVDLTGFSTATFNVCTMVGPLRVSDGATANMKNSIIWPIPAQPESVVIIGSGVALIEHSDVRGGFDGQGNFDEDPKFVGPAPGVWDYHINCNSPCREGGQQIAVYTGPTHDVDAQPRPVGLFVDVGADEKQADECP